MTDSEIHDIADHFKSQYMHGGTTFDEFDYLGFAKAILARQGTASGPDARVALTLGRHALKAMVSCSSCRNGPPEGESCCRQAQWDAILAIDAVLQP